MKPHINTTTGDLLRSSVNQNQRCETEPSNPTLINTAQEARKWISECESRVFIINSALLGISPSPCANPVEIDVQINVYDLLANVSSRLASLTGSLTTLLLKIDDEQGK